MLISAKNCKKIRNNLLFFAERMKTEKFEKLLANLYDRIENVIKIRNLRRASNHRLLLKIIHNVTKLNQKAWLESCTDMSPKLRKNAKNDFEKKIFFEMMNNAVFGKTMENVRKHKDSKLITQARKNYLVSEPNYHTIQFFFRKFISHRN